MALFAEDAYLFAHVALRDAAYQLWMPSDRARLHAAALAILEAMPEPELERIAGELAEHAHAAQQGVDSQRDATLLAQLRAAELKHLQVAMRAADKRYQRERVVEYCRRILASPALLPGEGGEFEQKLAAELHIAGKLDEAQSHFLNLARQAPNSRGKSWVSEALLGLGRIAAARGKNDEAEKYYTQSMQTAEARGDKGAQASALSWLAGLFEDTGRGHLSEAMQLTAVRLASESDSATMRLAAMGNLANHYRHTGRLDESAKTMREVLAGYEKLGDARFISVALNNLARTLLLQGKLDESDAAFSRALQLQEPMGRTFSTAFSLGNVAEVWLTRGKIEQAKSALERAIEICEESASRMHGASFKAKLAAVSLLAGGRERAQELVEEARTEFIQSGGAQYIPDYCDIVRLRIAADAATDSALLASRKTARVNALAPRASWLPVMRQILAGMKKSLSAQKAGVFELQRNIELGVALLAEVEAAVRENRPAKLLHGSLQAELTPELQAALAK